jgi:hypothetical protein
MTQFIYPLSFQRLWSRRLVKDMQYLASWRCLHLCSVLQKHSAELQGSQQWCSVREPPVLVHSSLLSTLDRHSPLDSLLYPFCFLAHHRRKGKGWWVADWKSSCYHAWQTVKYCPQSTPESRYGSAQSSSGTWDYLSLRMHCSPGFSCSVPRDIACQSFQDST